MWRANDVHHVITIVTNIVKLKFINVYTYVKDYNN